MAAIQFVECCLDFPLQSGGRPELASQVPKQGRRSE